MPYIGEIRMFGGNFAPAGWELCDGRLMPISEYDALFSMIGTTYGGDGETWFALPDLASRFPLHMGRGSDGMEYVIGETGGVEDVTLTLNQIPSHGHTPLAAATSQTRHPQGNVWANWGDAPFSDRTPSTPMAANALGPAGGSQPHENMPPYLAVNFIISLYGTLPQPG
ncbi:phage tail protein [Ruicaihuangia caeni]|uniref:Tail fiber protein n=1 Tax=Ruicaihuangia caeni TaxID=3042517 RepID=A0AAW6TAI6_9MICO|nr:tail fiber protein [Klugiella sp. YN-L-19]MDI2098993.1 tail fiber protein [Klugiella sp. YN-L-19]